MKRTTDVTAARQSLEFEVDDFLRKSGWESTSDTPGCYWLWQRKLPDGRIVLVDKAHALGMTASLESPCPGCEEYDGEDNECAACDGTGIVGVTP